MRYYFHTTEGDLRTVDDTGVELGSDDEALEVANRRLATLAFNAAKRDIVAGLEVQVAREFGEPLTTLTFSMGDRPDAGTLAGHLARSRKPWGHG